MPTEDQGGRVAGSGRGSTPDLSALPRVRLDLSLGILAMTWELGGRGPSQSFLLADHREIARRELIFRHPKP